MNLQQSARFTKQLHRLGQGNPHLIKQLEKTLEYLWRFPPAHPALHMKRIQGTTGTYEFSVNVHIQVTFEVVDTETILLPNIDHQDPELLH